MAIGMVPVLLAGGGVAYVAMAPSAPPPPPSALSATGGTKVSGGASSPLGAVLIRGGKTVVGGPMRGLLTPHFAVGGRGSSARAPDPVAGTWGDHSVGAHQVASGDPLINGKLSEIEAGAAAAYDKLSDGARKAGADALNDALDLDPPLTGDESWDDAARVVGAAAGGAAGTALCGPVCGALGSMLGAYLGTELGPLLSKGWDDLQEWVDGAWGDVSGAVSDAANAVGDQAEEYYDDASDYIGGLF